MQMQFLNSLLAVLIYNNLVSEVLCFQTNSYENHVDFTHANITRGALETAAAYYISNILEPGHYNLENQTTEEILTQYFSNEKETEQKFNNAVDAVIEGIEKASNDKKMSAKFTMNNEMIVEGIRYLFSKRTTIDVLSKDKNVDWFAVRMQVGEFLYTMQDFYSNTNWIEMGKGVLHSLGWNSTIDFPMARPDQPTCDSCTLVNGTTNGTCKDNLLVSNVLTSGYIDWKNGSGVKPYDQQWPQGQGKCSHGGKEDSSRLLPATGGINKESTSPLNSPHYYLHSKAGTVATEATVDFLIRNETSLLTALGYVLFGKLLGFEAKTHQSQQCVNCNDPTVSMVFVIDTTGSMASDIFQVRQKAVEIVTKAQMPGFSPANYILVTFNDPASKTTYQVTTNGEDMKNWLNALTVDGGGDCPEYAMSGLTTAMKHAANGSCVFLFTDADPKDPGLRLDVMNYIQTKNLHLVSFITGQCDGKLQNSTSHTSNSTNGGGSGSGCISSQHRRRKRSGNFFASLGGTYIPVPDRDISKPLDSLLEKNMAITYVNVYSSILSSGDLEILVDSRISAFTVEIKGASSSPEHSLHKPDGTLETFSGKSSFNDIGRSTYIMSVISPVPGKWILKNANSRNWQVSVKQQGDIEFTEKLLKPDDGSLLTVYGNPIAGEHLKLMVRVSDLHSTDTLTTAILLNGQRKEIVRINVTESTQGRRRIGIGSITVPNKPFTVAIEGIESGNKFRRESKNTIKPSSATLDIVTLDDVLYVGKDNKVKCNVTNLGPNQETFDLHVTDSASIVNTIKSVTVNAGATVTVSVIIHPNSGSSKSTILRSVLMLHGSEIQRQQEVFMMQAKQPPKIVVSKRSPFCHPLSLNYFNCSTEVLNVSAIVSTSSELKSFYTKPIIGIDMHNSSLNYSIFLTGTCCQPKFTLFVLNKDLLQSEVAFDFTNGHSFSTIIPEKPVRSAISESDKNNDIVYFAVGGALVAAAVTFFVVLAVFKMKPSPKVTSSMTFSNVSDDVVRNSRPRMPRSHFQQFGRK